MLYQKDPMYAALPHREWLKTPDGQRWAAASQQYGGAMRGSPSREDSIRDLIASREPDWRPGAAAIRPGRRPVSEGKGPPQGKPPKPKPPERPCYPNCNPDGTPTGDKACWSKPDPDCRPGSRPPLLPPNWPGFPFSRPRPGGGPASLGPQLPAGMTPYDIKGPFQR